MNPFDMDFVAPQPCSENVARILGEIQEERNYERAESRKSSGMIGMIFFGVLSYIPIHGILSQMGIVPWPSWIEKTNGWIVPLLMILCLWFYSLATYIHGSSYFESHRRPPEIMRRNTK